MNQRQPGLQDTWSSQEPSIGRLRLAELLAALSVVTDLGSWRLPETAMQACLLACTTLLWHAPRDAAIRRTSSGSDERAGRQLTPTNHDR